MLVTDAGWIRSLSALLFAHSNRCLELVLVEQKFNRKDFIEKGTDFSRLSSSLFLFLFLFLEPLPFDQLLTPTIIIIGTVRRRSR